MRLLYAPTEAFVRDETSRLAADVLAGSNVTLTVDNNDHFANTDYLVIGYEGSELAEMVQVNQVVVAGQSVQVAALKFNHRQGEPITKFLFNKRRFYGATSASGSFTELTSEGSPVDIQVDDPQGTKIEYTGTLYTYFKSTYLNSTTSVETDPSDSEAVLGDQSLRYASLWGIRKHAGLAGNPLYSDARLEDKRKQAESEINSVLLMRYILPLTEVPAILTQICELLAAGYIDYEEFGKDGEGVKWLGTARALLKSVGDGTQRLVGADGKELAVNEQVSVLSGYPNSSNDVGESGGPMFGTEQVF